MPGPANVTVSEAESLWFGDPPPPARPALAYDAHFDVAVVGGGIAGLTTALLLKRDGARVAVVEAGQVGGGVTGCNTAKATALQSTVYSTIRSRHGTEAAAGYAEFSRAGVELIAELADSQAIDCDLARRPAFTYAAQDPDLDAVEREEAAAAAAGLPARLTDSIDLPFSIAGAVRLDDQIAFHPVRYVRGLADAVDGDGSVVYEQSRVVSVADERPCRVRTASGSITADRVVVATHYPFLDRALFFARLEVKRSYCIAVRVREPLPRRDVDQRRVDHAIDPLVRGPADRGRRRAYRRFARRRPGALRALEAFAREHWDVETVTNRWSAQDPVPYDHLPIVGRYWPGTSRLSSPPGS